MSSSPKTHAAPSAPVCDSPARDNLAAINPTANKKNKSPIYRPLRHDSPLDRKPAAPPAAHPTTAHMMPAPTPQHTIALPRTHTPAPAPTPTHASRRMTSTPPQASPELQMEAITLAHRLIPMLPPGIFIVCLRTEPGHPPYTPMLRSLIHEEIARNRPYHAQRFFLLLPHEYDDADYEILRTFAGPSDPRVS